MKNWFGRKNIQVIAGLAEKTQGIDHGRTIVNMDE